MLINVDKSIIFSKKLIKIHELYLFCSETLHHIVITTTSQHRFYQFPGLVCLSPNDRPMPTILFSFIKNMCWTINIQQMYFGQNGKNDTLTYIVIVFIKEVTNFYAWLLAV
ncbi:MAG: hypothetical protein ACI9Y7_000490 [Dokdonia sp.]|jgi:hypothetical protein